MNQSIILALGMNVFYILPGMMYLMNASATMPLLQKTNLDHWSKRNASAYYKAIGYLPFFIEAILACSNSFFSETWFSLYMIITGLLYWYSGWSFISRLLLIEKSSLSIARLELERIIPRLGGLGVTFGISLFLATLGTPVIDFIKYLRAPESFLVIGILLTSSLAAFIERRIQKNIAQLIQQTSSQENTL